MSTIGKSLIATTAAVLMLSFGSVAPAQAHGKKFHFHGHHHHHGMHFHRPHFHHYSYGYGGGCGYFKRIWWKTGNYYWKAKYYECRAW